MRYGVILLPGIMASAMLTYRELLRAFRDVDNLLLPDLAVFNGDRPPSDYSLGAEIAATAKVADKEGLDRYHLVGFSYGGAVAVALAAGRPQSVASSALIEPSWLGNTGMSAGERGEFAKIERAMWLPPEQAQSEFMRLNLSVGVEPPDIPAGPLPDWMAKRTAGLRTAMAALRNAEIDPAALRSLRRPVLYILGGLSNPRLFRRRAERAAQLVSDFELSVFEGRHHFDLPQVAEPEETAEILEAFWRRAEASTDVAQ